MKRTVIRGTGRYVPPRLVTNDDLSKWMETSDEWIRQRTGIEQRYWTPEEGGVGSSDLGLEASKLAIQRAGWQPEDIDMIIFATLSPDLFFPGSGALLQHKLGLNSIPALDIRQQCTGFLYGNTTAASIPIALDEAIEMNLIGDGNTVLFLGLGSGLTWGAVIARLVG